MQRKHFKGYVFSLIALTVLLVSLISMGAVFAKGASSSHQGRRAASTSGVTVSATRGSTSAVSARTVDLFSLPKESTSTVSANHGQIPVRTSPNLAAAKKVAAHNANAPKAQPLASTGTGVSTTTGRIGFRGMADSATICPYFGGCQPPDMALATSPQFVLQGVNTSYAVYDTLGNLVVGPIEDNTWYGVPALPNNCDPAGPFLSDPRAFYDPNTGLFWTATLQVEAAAFGVGVNCPNTSIYWVANINMKTHLMHIYAFDMTLGGSVNAGADYTQFGFSGSTITFTGNMFDFTTGNYDFAEVQFADKATMEAGLPVTPVAFTNLAVGKALVDTVQPVETETTSANDPVVQYLVNSFNMNGDPFGDDCLTTACSGFVVWAFDPATPTFLTGALVLSQIPNLNYVSPPNADEPGCFQCIETIDTRITGTPVYSVGGGAGLISFSIDTAVNNGGPVFPSIVPGILWGQIQVGYVTGNSTFPPLVLANLFQSGYLTFTGDRAASFGAMMQDKNGRLVMVFDTMSANLNPSIMVAFRLKSDPLGTIGHTSFIIKGPVPTFNSRWGDYEAASYDGFNANHTWVASEYSVNGDWATFIARV